MKYTILTYPLCSDSYVDNLVGLVRSLKHHLHSDSSDAKIAMLYSEDSFSICDADLIAKRLKKHLHSSKLERNLKQHSNRDEVIHSVAASDDKPDILIVVAHPKILSAIVNHYTADRAFADISSDNCHSGYVIDHNKQTIDHIPKPKAS